MLLVCSKVTSLMNNNNNNTFRAKTILKYKRNIIIILYQLLDHISDSICKSHASVLARLFLIAIFAGALALRIADYFFIFLASVRFSLVFVFVVFFFFFWVANAVEHACQA